MRRVCLFAELTLLCWVVAAPVHAQSSFSLDHVDGLISPGALDGNTTATFHIRMTNNSGGTIVGMTNGFRVYSPTGGTWTTTEGLATGAITSGMIDAYFVNPFSIDGMGADTVGFSGSRKRGPGASIGFNEVVYTISTQVDDAQHGKQLCLDSY